MDLIKVMFGGNNIIKYQDLLRSSSVNFTAKKVSNNEIEIDNIQFESYEPNSYYLIASLYGVNSNLGGVIISKQQYGYNEKMKLCRDIFILLMILLALFVNIKNAHVIILYIGIIFAILLAYFTYYTDISNIVTTYIALTLFCALCIYHIRLVCIQRHRPEEIE